jgi:signal recognition particle receptor subunit beta
MRPYWRHYFSGTQGIVFVVDASDRARLDAAAAELRTLAADIQLSDAAVLVLANKADAPGAMACDELSRVLDLPATLAGHPWLAQATVARTGAGVDAGLAFLAANMKAL